MAKILNNFLDGMSTRKSKLRAFLISMT